MSIFSFVAGTFGVKFMKALPISKSRAFPSYFLWQVLEFRVLCLSLQSIFSWFLCIVWENIFPFLKSTRRHLVFLIFYLPPFLSSWTALSGALQDSCSKDDWCGIYGDLKIRDDFSRSPIRQGVYNVRSLCVKPRESHGPPHPKQDRSPFLNATSLLPGVSLCL